MSKSKSIVKGSSGKGKKTASLTERQSSPISAHSYLTGTPQAIREWLIASREVFPAKISPAPEKGEASQVSDQAFGRSWPRPFALYDRASRLWKIPQCSLFEDSEQSLEAWPRWGLMLAGVCWERLTPARHTEGKEFGYWPTPTANPAPRGVNSQWTDSHYYPHDLANAVKMWPTPRSNDAEKRGNFDLENPRNGLAAAAKLWPTPTESMMTIQDMEQARYAGNSLSRPKYRDALPTPAARDYRSPNKNGNMQDQLPNVIGGSLNPDWVEWLMGWPIGWTALGPLNPQAFREWLQAFKTGWQG